MLTVPSNAHQKVRVPLLQLCWQVPVVQGDKGLDAVGEQLVDEIRIELDALLVNGIFSPSLGNHS